MSLSLYTNAKPEPLVDTVKLIEENCEPALCTVLFVGGAGGSLRSGVTKNPVKLTKSIQNKKTELTSGGANPYIWPGGGITFMVNVLDMPENAFGYVPTPAIVAPLEFTLTKENYQNLGGHVDDIRTIKDIFCRFKSLKGYYVDRKAGWDTHGLPVELSVEKLLSITKEDIMTQKLLIYLKKLNFY